MSDRRRFGTCVALATPFAADGAVDNQLLCRHARRVLDRGCSSLALFGTTGEGSSVGADERRAALAALRDAGIGGESLVLGVTVSAVEDGLAQARLAGEAGCRRLLVTPPFYYKDISPEGLRRWYAAFLGGLPSGEFDVILYNIPQVTGVSVPVEVVASLRAEFPSLVFGIKDSAGDWDYTSRLLDAFRDMAVLVGDERYVARAIARGGAGTISGIANFRPDMMISIVEGGPADPALMPLVEAILAYPVTAAVKTLLAHTAGEDGWRVMRPPLAALDPAETQALEQRYRELAGGKTG